MGEDNALSAYACQAYGRIRMATHAGRTQNRAMKNDEIASLGPVDVAIGRALARLRKEAGLTQEQLAERSSIEQTAISKYENAKQGLPASKLAVLAKAIGVAASDIWRAAESDTSTADSAASSGAPRKLVKPGSSERASEELIELRANNDVEALQWAIGAVVRYLAATRPGEISDLKASFESLPNAYRSSGLGLTIRKSLAAAESAPREAGRSTAKPRGTPKVRPRKSG